MKERVKFVLEWERRLDEGDGLMNFAQLCREFGISRHPQLAVPVQSTIGEVLRRRGRVTR